MQTLKFNKEEEEYLCYLIGDWYTYWKDKITDPSNTHKLGIACSNLKELICNGSWAPIYVKSAYSPMIHNDDLKKMFSTLNSKQLAEMLLMIAEEIAKRMCNGN